MTDSYYFQFIPEAWLAGDIQNIPYDSKGFFCDLCALFFKKNGKICEKDVKNRFKMARKHLAVLEEQELIEIHKIFEEKTGKTIRIIDIKFLSEQLDKLQMDEATRLRRSEAGKLGAKARWQTHGKSDGKPDDKEDGETEEGYVILDDTNDGKVMANHGNIIVRNIVINRIRVREYILQPDFLKEFLLIYSCIWTKNNFRQWLRILERFKEFTFEDLVQVIEAVKSGERWPEKIEAGLENLNTDDGLEGLNTL